MNAKSKYIKSIKKHRENIKIKQNNKNKIKIVNDIIIDSPKTFLQQKKKYSYDINTILGKNESNISKNINKIFVCIYIVISDKNRINVSLPYLQFLLFKYKKDGKLSNTCIFPFVEKNSKSYIKDADNLVHELIDIKIKADGFIQSNNNLFVFYNYTNKCKPFLHIPKKEEKEQLWWTTIDEICNQRKIIYFPIHKSVTNLFLNYPKLIYINDSDGNNIEIPIIGYYGDYYKFIPMIATLGQKIANPDKAYDKFFYVTDFKKSVRYACWTSNYSSRTFNDIIITDENGKYEKGGIIRFAVFMHKVFCPNKWLTEDDLDKYKLSKEFDSIYIGRTLKKDGSYISIAPTYIIKDFKQHVPLSIHSINSSKLPDIWNHNLEFSIE
jgi:hypothetical protein